ncbi:MAG TPA: hypothetical protein VGL20_10430 [Candidatus Dormibacteraeota bacterium]|jgi:hypothetical protein
MISVDNAGVLHATLLESLTNDLHEVADLAAQFAEPDRADAARAAVARWSPTRTARTLVEAMLED